MLDANKSSLSRLKKIARSGHQSRSPSGRGKLWYGCICKCGTCDVTALCKVCVQEPAMVGTFKCEERLPKPLLLSRRAHSAIETNPSEHKHILGVGRVQSEWS